MEACSFPPQIKRAILRERTLKQMRSFRSGAGRSGVHRIPTIMIHRGPLQYTCFCRSCKKTLWQQGVSLNAGVILRTLWRICLTRERHLSMMLFIQANPIAYRLTYDPIILLTPTQTECPTLSVDRLFHSGTPVGHLVGLRFPLSSTGQDRRSFLEGPRPADPAVLGDGLHIAAPSCPALQPRRPGHPGGALRHRALNLLCGGQEACRSCRRTVHTTVPLVQTVYRATRSFLQTLSHPPLQGRRVVLRKKDGGTIG